MGLTLYQIDERLQQAMEAADYEASQNDGIIPEELAAQLDGLEMEREQKAINIARYIKNLNAEAAAYDAEADRLFRNARAVKNRVDFLKSWISYIMPGWKYKDATCTVSWRKSERLEIIDANSVPAEFKRIVTEEKIDKTAIKEAIKTTGTVDYAKIVECQNIQIR